MTKPLELVHVDTCLPCYWSGHHLAYISVPVYKGIRLNELKILLKSELSQGFVTGSDDLAFLLSADFVGVDRDNDARLATRRAHAAVNRIQPMVKGKRKLFDSLEEESDDSEHVYAYFVFVEKESVK